MHTVFDDKYIFLYTYKFLFYAMVVHKECHAANLIQNAADKKQKWKHTLHLTNNTFY